MATALILVRRALRLATIIAASETPDAATIQDALSVLNSILAEMHDAGIGIPDYSVANEASTLTMGDGDVEAVAYQLAARIMPEYGMEIPPTVAAGAADSMSRLRAKYFQPGKSDLGELPVATGWGYGWNVESGSY
ncbi:hypothetical protein ABIE51_001462 [Lysobacter sp. OAE881]|uniref:packaged DNA stabilization gp4 family protein n=1 Tax=Lysobacter sp. OAE881 TaxID=2663813 RepID=UPI0017895815